MILPRPTLKSVFIALPVFMCDPKQAACPRLDALIWQTSILLESDSSHLNALHPAYAYGSFNHIFSFSPSNSVIFIDSIKNDRCFRFLGFPHPRLPRLGLGDTFCSRTPEGPAEVGRRNKAIKELLWWGHFIVSEGCQKEECGKHLKQQAIQDLNENAPISCETSCSPTLSRGGELERLPDWV